MESTIKAVLFDFGGVVAEEGFKEGLRAIGKKNGLDPDGFFTTADALIYETGYLTGNADEESFWNAVREMTGINGSDRELRGEILSRFVLRPKMIAYAELLRSKGFTVALLSDQTNWLDELNKKMPLFRHFDRIFNSFKLRKSKRDPSVFKDVCQTMGFVPREVLFVDDNANHVERAWSEGLKTIHFTTMEDFEKQIRKYL